MDIDIALHDAEEEVG